MWPLQLDVLVPESNEYVVGGLHPVGVPPLELVVDKGISHTSPVFNLHFVCQFVERANQFVSCTILSTRAVVCIPVLTLSTTAHCH